MNKKKQDDELDKLQEQILDVLEVDLNSVHSAQYGIMSKLIKEWAKEQVLECVGGGGYDAFHVTKHKGDPMDYAFGRGYFEAKDKVRQRIEEKFR